MLQAQDLEQETLILLEIAQPMLAAMEAELEL